MIFLIRILLLLTVFLIPILPASGQFGWEQIKVVTFLTLNSLAGFLWLIWLSKNQIKISWSRVKIASILFILMLFLSALLGTDPMGSLLGKDPYFQGWILYAEMFLFMLMVSTVEIPLMHWATALAAGSVMVSLLAIKEAISLYLLNMAIPNYAGRVVSTFGQPNFYAGFLLLTLPFCYFLLTKSNKGSAYLAAGSGLLALVGILVSYSRSAIILALLLLILGLIDQLKGKFKMMLVCSAIVFISIIGALRFSSGLVGSEVSRPIFTNNPDLTKESVEKRAYIWPVAWQLFLIKPLSGYGLENISQTFSDYFISNKHLLFEENLKISPVLISLKELNIDRTHNYILDVLLFSGIFGLLAWIYLVVVLLLKSKKYKILFVSAVSYLIWVQFQNQGVVHLIYFWLLVGLIDQHLFIDKHLKKKLT